MMYIKHFLWCLKRRHVPQILVLTVIIHTIVFDIILSWRGQRDCMTKDELHLKRDKHSNHPEMGLSGMGHRKAVFQEAEPKFTHAIRIKNSINSDADESNHQKKVYYVEIDREKNRDIEKNSLGNLEHTYSRFIRNNYNYSSVLKLAQSVGNLLKSPFALRSRIVRKLSESSSHLNGSVLLKANITAENRHAIHGGVGHYDPAFKNPCWMSNRSYADILQSYTSSKYYKYAFYTCRATSRMDKLLSLYKSHPAESGRLRCLPYFYIGGVTKAGTTDLFSALSRHPEIVAPVCKEPTYWNRARLGGLEHITRVSFSQYVDLFDTMEERRIQGDMKVNNLITFEATPAYLWDFYAWTKLKGNQRYHEPLYHLSHTLHEINPSTKFIFILRNPTDRVYSHFRMFYQEESPEIFHRLVMEGIKNFTSCLSWSSLRSCVYNRRLCTLEDTGALRRVCSFMTASMYFVHIRDWLSVFKWNQILLIKAEEYYSDRISQIKRILKFLNIDAIPAEYEQYVRTKIPENTKKTHPGRSKAAMLPETRELLNSLYRPITKQLQQLTSDKRWVW